MDATPLHAIPPTDPCIQLCSQLQASFSCSTSVGAIMERDNGNAADKAHQLQQQQQQQQQQLINLHRHAAHKELVCNQLTSLNFAYSSSYFF